MKLLHLLLCTFVIFSGCLVAFSVNPIQSVLALIATFFCAGSIMLLMHSEFFGLAFVIIYVGAIAVLFLFVIMMLNIKRLKNEMHSIFGSFKMDFIVFFVFGYSILASMYVSVPKLFKKNDSYFMFFDSLYETDSIENIGVLGQVLYNYYFSCFLLAGLILLVALIGSIVLTLRFYDVKKTQLINKQIARSDKFISFFK